MPRQSTVLSAFSPFDHFFFFFFFRANAGAVPLMIVLIRKSEPVDHGEERLALFRKRVNLDQRLFVSFVRSDEHNSAKTFVQRRR